MKDLLIKNWQLITLFVLAVIVANQCAWQSAQKDINDANRQRDNLLQQVAEQGRKVDGLAEEKVLLQEEMRSVSAALFQANESLEVRQAEIQSLKDHLADARATTKDIRTNDDLIVGFKEHFPEFAMAEDLGVMEVADSDGLLVAVATMPAWIIKRMILDRLDAENLKKQVNEYMALEREYGTIVDLHEQNQDLLTQLEEKTNQQKIAFQEGRNACLANYDILHEKYIDRLNQPRIDLGSKWAWIGGAAIGAGACGAITGRISW